MKNVRSAGRYSLKRRGKSLYYSAGQRAADLKRSLSKKNKKMTRVENDDTGCFLARVGYLLTEAIIDTIVKVSPAFRERRLCAALGKRASHCNGHH